MITPLDIENKKEKLKVIMLYNKLLYVIMRNMVCLF